MLARELEFSLICSGSRLKDEAAKEHPTRGVAEIKLSAFSIDSVFGCGPGG